MEMAVLKFICMLFKDCKDELLKTLKEITPTYRRFTFFSVMLFGFITINYFAFTIFDNEYFNSVNNLAHELLLVNDMGSLFYFITDNIVTIVLLIISPLIFLAIPLFVFSKGGAFVVFSFTGIYSIYFTSIMFSDFLGGYFAITMITMAILFSILAKKVLYVFGFDPNSE
jgi:hypothetical protein